MEIRITFKRNHKCEQFNAINLSILFLTVVCSTNQNIFAFFFFCTNSPHPITINKPHHKQKPQPTRTHKSSNSNNQQLQHWTPSNLINCQTTNIQRSSPRGNTPIKTSLVMKPLLLIWPWDSNYIEQIWSTKHIYDFGTTIHNQYVTD